MASFLDIGILDYFLPVFVFILIYGIILALLEKTKVFGESRAANQIVAVAIAILFVLTPDLVGLVKIITPWFTVLFIFVLMIILLFLFVGVKEGDVASAFKDRGMIWIIIVICLIIFMYAMTQVYGESIHSIYAGGEGNVSGEADLKQQVGQIIFHPRILGMLFLIVVAAQAVRMIAGTKS